MTDQAPATGELTYTRVFDAPRELVFRCMLEPEHLTHFWGPAGVSTPLEAIKVDPRPGGVFETVMVNDSDGSRYPTRAVYVEITEPERIVWTEPGSGVTTTSTFRDLGGDAHRTPDPAGQRPRGVPQPRGAGRVRDLTRPLRRLPRQARRRTMTTPSATNDARLQPAVAAEFASLAGLLAATSVAQWDTPSMCRGWRVREVVAHMTMAARYSQEEFMAELSRCEFDFTRLSNEVASRDASLPVDELVASLRSGIMQRWTPPGGGYHGALTHVVIHGLDVTVPLGAPRCSPDETIRVVLDNLTAGGGHAHFSIVINGRRLQATDLDWSHGSGQVLRGAAADLALALCGRAIPAGRLEGEPLPRG